MSLRKILLPLFALMLALPTYSQIYTSGSSGYWKQHRKEIFGGVGGALYRGDLGNLRESPVDSWLAGQEFDVVRPAAHIGMRYFLTSNIALRGSFAYARLTGSDENAGNVFRENRNLNFRTNVFEAALIGELHIFKERVSHRHGLRGARGRTGFSFGLYAFGGIGAFYFDPQGFYDIPGVGSGWVNLQPLGTEGQNLPGGERYDRIAMSMPLGLGIKKSLSRNISVGIEVSYRFTNTDYLDDVSGNYVDPLQVALVSGPIAGFMADPSLGRNLDPAVIEALNLPFRPNWTAPGEQRGNPDNDDGFMMATFTLTYRIFENPRNFSSRGKRGARSPKKLVF
ncbi:MAG: hypothetical protein ACXITV_07935 [Luteibaculaceae bacterium]